MLLRLTPMRLLSFAASFFVLVSFVGAIGSDAVAQERRVPASPNEVRLSYAPIVQRVAAAVVNVYAGRQVTNRNPLLEDPIFRRFFGMPGMPGAPGGQMQQSLGSGVLVDAGGLVVTNNHVIEGATEVKVSLADKREFEAEIVLKDSRSDLAVLRLKAQSERFPAIDFADSDALQVGDLVLAIGNPFAVGQTVTHGIVSAVARTQIGITDYQFFIQTDAAINPGNSGGALVNRRGELVGINTWIYSESGGYQGIGFAVPSNLARRVMDDLIRYGEVHRGSIGPLETIPLTTQIAEELGVDTDRGAVVARMSRSGTAYQAGLRPGDVIVSMNGKPIDDPGQFLRMLSDTPSGTTVAIGVVRGGGRQEFKVRVTGGEARQR